MGDKMAFQDVSFLEWLCEWQLLQLAAGTVPDC